MDVITGPAERVKGAWRRWSLTARRRPFPVLYPITSWRRVLVIPDITQVGTSDVQTWRAVPAQNNPSGDELGAWAVVAGDGEEADVFLDVTAEYPQRVAEFVATAVRAEAAGRRFAGAAGDIAAELDRQRHADQPLTAAGPYLADPVRLAMLVEQLGVVAREITTGGGQSRGEAGKRLYEHLIQVGATTIGWMEALLARDLADGQAREEAADQVSQDG
ncbi:hypothetical protein [Actinoallomurus sp. CA-150999]|uniref:hypothetical protein n=1 Tax=Actinoallomurus sp. CA-150999 TaxID=3239887 RepID=UPI003D93F197